MRVKTEDTSAREVSWEGWGSSRTHPISCYSHSCLFGVTVSRYGRRERMRLARRDYAGGWGTEAVDLGKPGWVLRI